ncbi:hypothetical protein EDB83DRAFT_1784674 [Lactarius deliciosus]|nr:hypothetical protein EDB83DRAFT_1784674 [Lactarius deliciosus]
MPRRHDLASPRSNTVLYISGTTLFFHNQRLLTNTKKTVGHPFKSIENWANNVTVLSSATATTSQTSSSCDENPIVKYETHRPYPAPPSWLCKRFPNPRLNACLPPGAETNNRFRRVFIPTYERWVGTRANTWVIPDHVAIPVLQTIWDAVYMEDGVEWTFKANDPVFYCVNRRLCEWRASFKSTAEIMFEQFFEFSMFSYDERQEWAADELDNLKFVWGNDEKGKRRFMHSPFILRVFAAHLISIAGAIDIEDLEVDGLPASASSTQKYPPRGALALATAAVERVLQLWANGEMDAPVTVPAKRKFKKTYLTGAPRLNPVNGDISTFSADVWAAPTTNYYKSIAKVKPARLEAIVKEANIFLSQAHLQGLLVVTDGVEEDNDIRACLMDNSDLDSGSGSE